MRTIDKAAVDGAPKDPPFASLFTVHRVRRPFGPAHTAFAVYCVLVGLPLLVLRLLLLVPVHVAFVLLPAPVDRIFLRASLAVCFGWIVRTHNRNAYPPSPIISSNHSSELDGYSMHCLGSFQQLTAFPYYSILPKKLGLIFVKTSPDRREELREQIRDRLKRDKRPLISFSEGGFTNGRVGLMVYNKFLFGLGLAVQPVSIRVWNPWPIEHDRLGSTNIKNFLFIGLMPFLVVDVKFLPPVSITEGETDADFAARVQGIVARDIGVQATGHMYKSKAALARSLYG